MKKHIVIVDEDYFNKHLSIFMNKEHCKWTKVIIVDDMFDNDETYKKLVKTKQKAEKELRDYEYNKRNK